MTRGTETTSPLDLEQGTDTIHTLDHDGRRIVLVGTAHVSQESVDEVRRVIADVRPDTVCIELDQARFDALTNDERWKKLDVFKVIRDGKTLYLLANVALSAWQRRLGDKLGVRPGAELLSAARAAEEIGAKVLLVDRDVHTTLRRTWGNLSFMSKAKMMAALVGSPFMPQDEEPSAQDIEQLKDKANLARAMEELTKMLPEVKEPLIDERDRYMISNIREAPGRSIVAVVGAAHVEGMKRHIETPVDRAALEQAPPKSTWVALLKWLIPLAILVLFWVGFRRHEGQTLDEMLWAWILPNSIMCALLTALAGAKPLSVVTGFIASPITSLNPMVPAGVVVGLVEAWLRRPTVEDTERAVHDIQTLRGIYGNRFTRVMLVVVASTMGSALGAWVGLGWLAKIVAG